MNGTIMNGCQGKPEPKPMEKKCPCCGTDIEICYTGKGSQTKDDEDNGNGSHCMSPPSSSL